MKKLNTEIFIEKANKLHNNKYSYSVSEYKNIRSKIKILCEKHGEFEQLAGSHLEGHGCFQCGLENYHKPTKTNDQFIQLANIKHDYFYDYSKTIYIRNDLKVIITCPTHGDFEQAPCMHLSRSGCPKCARDNSTGFSKERFVQLCNYKHCDGPKLYIIRCFNESESFYKIGITSRTIKQRFHGNRMPYAYEVISEKTGTPEAIYELEKEMHKKHKQYKYNPKIEFPGSARECFSNLIK